jgi:hypothetical protein
VYESGGKVQSGGVLEGKGGNRIGGREVKEGTKQAESVQVGEHVESRLAALWRHRLESRVERQLTLVAG